MKVQLVILTQILVICSVTVPPNWSQQNEQINYKQSVPVTSILSEIDNKFQFPSFFPPDDKSTLRFEDDNLQFRSPNIQNLHVFHPQVRSNVLKNHSPQSYQIIHFDNQNAVPIKHKIKPKNNRQHLTEVYQPTESGSSQNSFEEQKLDDNKQNKEVDESFTKESEEENEKISEHEIALEIPTKPIYPGEGKWAKYGTKHKPYLHHQKADEEYKESEEDRRPEGYETFETGQAQFHNAQNNFQNDINTFPQKHQLKHSEIDDTETDSKPLYEKPEIGFIPEKLYTQVRKTETTQYLPRSEIDPEQEENADRLREVIKDSVIHTVYTEEGYEDSAYDHAGHEKNAENHEGHAQVANEQTGSFGKSRNNGKSLYSDNGGKKYGSDYIKTQLQNEEISKQKDFDEFETFLNKKKEENDAEIAGSDYESKKVMPNVTTIPSKNIKRIILKNGPHEDIDMEIHTEIKYTPQKKKHKYVKIIPSTKKYKDFPKLSLMDASKMSLKRVKRYDKEKLSKKYVRQRPSYYWKRNKTTTTEKPLLNTKRNFEAAFKTHNKVLDKHILLYPPIEEALNKSPKTSEVIKTTTIKTTSTSTTPLTTKYTSTTTSTTPVTTKYTSATTTTENTTPIPYEELHDDLKNPELTTKTSKPSTPKILPVKIRKFKAKRQKRYTNDFPKINVDLKEFIDVRKLPDPTQKPDLTYIKYPYYNLPIDEYLNENSPLRYAEDMNRIPTKVENEMSFYDSRAHIICSEIESDVNPIPDRIQNQNEGEETNKMAEIPELPRLAGLGDKIDCLKVKYFGENPLDSPFFQEEIIEEPIPFFSINSNFNKKDSVNNHQRNLAESNFKDFFADPDISKKSNSKKRELKITVLEPIVVIDDQLFESATANPIHQNTEAVLRPPYTLTEMMIINNKNVSDLKPENIYDQISLLDIDDESSNENVNSPLSDKFIIVYDSPDTNPSDNKNAEIILVNEKEENTTEQNNFQSVVSSTIKPQGTKIRKRPVIDTIRKLPEKKILKPQSRGLKKFTTIPIPLSPSPTSQSDIKTNHFTKQTNQSSAESRPRADYNWQFAGQKFTPFPYIFDITKFLPPVLNHKLLTSEVQYKQDIKPSEQMRLYVDVLKSINVDKEINGQESLPNAVKLTVSNDKEKLHNPIISQEPEQIKENQSVLITQLGTSQSDGELRINLTNNITSPEIIAGLVPPSNETLYRTIQDSNFTEIQKPEGSTRINYYHVIGLKPPKEEKYYIKHIISKREITNSNQKVLNPQRRLKRNVEKKVRQQREPDDDLLMEASENKPVYSSPPQRKPKVYTEIVRSRPLHPPEEEDIEEEVDLNPRKRIYELKSSKSTTTEIYPEIEEYVIEEAIVEPTEPTTTPEPVIYPVEANSKNPDVAQYIFFIEKLHEKWAKEDATSTTEAKPETTTEAIKTVMTQEFSESINERRGEPAYLQIINQLHQIRKEEESKTASPSTEPTTTEKLQTIPIKNSNPFILDSDNKNSFISELNSMKVKFDEDNTAEGSNNPEVSSRSKNFTARFNTAIDTSKYKNIDRGPVSVRHNLSSRFNADDQLPLNKGQTTQTPMLIAIITRPYATTTTDISNEKIDNVTEIVAEVKSNQTELEEPRTSTIKSRQRGRVRSRPSTVSTTTSIPTTTSTINPLYRRRRPNRLTTTTTTTTTQPTTTASETNFNRRRNRLKISEAQTLEPQNSSNNKNVVSPAPSTTEEIVVITPEPKKQRRFQKVQERRVMSQVTLTRFYEPVDDEFDDNSEETRKHQYEVVGPLQHTDTGHGGNYKHKNDTTVTDNFEEVETTIIPQEDFFTGPNLATNINQLKENSESSTAKSQASNILLTNEEIEEKVAQKLIHSKVSLYPNMARMINRLAETKTEEITTTPHDIGGNSGNSDHKPIFIKDPSRRMYYYAKL